MRRQGERNARGAALMIGYKGCSRVAGGKKTCCGSPTGAEDFNFYMFCGASAMSGSKGFLPKSESSWDGRGFPPIGQRAGGKLIRSLRSKLWAVQSFEECAPNLIGGKLSNSGGPSLHHNVHDCIEIVSHYTPYPVSITGCKGSIRCASTHRVQRLWCAQRSARPARAGGSG